MKLWLCVVGVMVCGCVADVESDGGGGAAALVPEEIGDDQAEVKKWKVLCRNPGVQCAV